MTDFAPLRVAPPVDVRFLVRADVEACQSIEDVIATPNEWTRKRLVDLTRQRGVIGHVAFAPSNHGLCGYVLARTAGNSVEIERIAIYPPAQRLRVGTLLLNKEVRTAHRAGRTVFARVSELEYPALCFFRFNGFAAYKTVRRLNEPDLILMKKVAP